MNKRGYKTIYLITTGLLSLLMLFSAGMYFFNHQMVVDTFERLGYPTYIIYPLAIAKILGLIAIWSRKSTTLREWAYAGFFFDFLLAFTAHLYVKDGEHFAALMAMIFLLVSYYSGWKMMDHEKN